MLEHPLDRGGLEQVRAELDRHPQTLGNLAGEQRQVKFGRAAFSQHALMLQPSQRRGPLHRVLEHKQHLRHRRVALRTLGIELLDQLLERQVLI